MARADMRPARWGRWILVPDCSEVVGVSVSGDGHGEEKGTEWRSEVNGRVLRVKTSPETRMGTLVPKVEVRISRAETSMGVLDGVDRVRGWIVRKSM